MDCKAWQNEISRREADLLEPNQQKALDGHLVTCAACKAVSDRVRQGIQAMAAMPITPAPKNFLDDSWRRIQKVAPPKPAGPLERLKRWFEGLSQPPVWLPLGAAAAVVLAITVLPSLRDGGGLQPQYRVLAQDGAVKITPAPNGGAILETLGGSLSIEHQGRATYALSGNGNRLQIGVGRLDAVELAAGNAEVRVKADPTRPYAVEISGAKVVVTGTFFRLGAGKPSQVELVEGKIQLVGRDFSRDLKPGDKVSFSETGLIEPKAAMAAPASVAAPAAPAVTAAPASARPSPARVAPASSTLGAAARPVSSPQAPAVTARVPPAPTVPAAGASETDTAGQQLNDPFQGR